MNFGKMLKKYREDVLNINKTELAELLGVSLPYIINVESDKKTSLSADKLKLLKEISVSKFNVQSNIANKHYEDLKDQAIKEKAEKSIYKLQDSFGLIPKSAEFMVREPAKRTVPILSYISAAEFQSNGDADYPPGEGMLGSIETDVPGLHVFALKVIGDCMQPEFRENDIIIIDPDSHINNGDYVIAKIDDEDEATFKQYKIIESTVILHPLNPDYNDITFNINQIGKKVRIIGRVMEKKKKY